RDPYRKSRRILQKRTIENETLNKEEDHRHQHGGRLACGPLEGRYPAAMTTESLKPVALVSMPTLSARFPSFQLALLKPTLQRAGIPVQTFSLFMYFGTHVGWRINEALSDVYPCMVGEWIWTKAAFGDFADDEEYLEIYRGNLESICHQ